MHTLTPRSPFFLLLIFSLGLAPTQPAAAACTVPLGAVSLAKNSEAGQLFYSVEEALKAVSGQAASYELRLGSGLHEMKIKQLKEKKARAASSDLRCDFQEKFNKKTNVLIAGPSFCGPSDYFYLAHRGRKIAVEGKANLRIMSDCSQAANDGAALTSFASNALSVADFTGKAAVTPGFLISASTNITIENLVIVGEVEIGHENNKAQDNIVLVGNYIHPSLGEAEDNNPSHKGEHPGEKTHDESQTDGRFHQEKFQEATYGISIGRGSRNVLLMDNTVLHGQEGLYIKENGSSGSVEEKTVIAFGNKFSANKYNGIKIHSGARLVLGHSVTGDNMQGEIRHNGHYGIKAVDGNRNPATILSSQEVLEGMIGTTNDKGGMFGIEIVDVSNTLPYFLSLPVLAIEEVPAGGTGDLFCRSGDNNVNDTDDLFILTDTFDLTLFQVVPLAEHKMKEYLWFENGILIAGTSSQQISASRFSLGAQVSCQVRLNDGIATVSTFGPDGQPDPAGQALTVSTVFNPDSDGDGTRDLTDNCRMTPNPEQGDFDQNGEGELCQFLNYPNPASDGAPDVAAFKTAADRLLTKVASYAPNQIFQDQVRAILQDILTAENFSTAEQTAAVDILTQLAEEIQAILVRSAQALDYLAALSNLTYDRDGDNMIGLYDCVNDPAQPGASVIYDGAPQRREGLDNDCSGAVDLAESVNMAPVLTSATFPTASVQVNSTISCSVAATDEWPATEQGNPSIAVSLYQASGAGLAGTPVITAGAGSTTLTYTTLPGDSRATFFCRAEITDHEPAATGSPVLTTVWDSAAEAQSVYVRNTDPAFAPGEDSYSTDENTNLTFTVTATDVDLNPVTVTCSGCPEGSSFTGSGGQMEFSWTPGFTATTREATPSAYELTFTASDLFGGSANIVIPVSVRDVLNKSPYTAAFAAASKIDKAFLRWSATPLATGYRLFHAQSTSTTMPDESSYAKLGGDLAAETLSYDYLFTDEENHFFKIRAFYANGTESESSRAAPARKNRSKFVLADSYSAPKREHWITGSEIDELGNFYSTSFGSVIISRDEGQSWEWKNFADGVGQTYGAINSPLYYDRSAARLWVKTNLGLYSSDDHGQTFAKVVAPELNLSRCNGFYAEGQKLLCVRTLVGTNSRRAYLSLDGGQTATVVSDFSGSSGPEVAYIDGDIMTVSVGSVLRVSVDSGTSFTEVGGIPNGHSVYSAARLGEELFFGITIGEFPNYGPSPLNDVYSTSATSPSSLVARNQTGVRPSVAALRKRGGRLVMAASEDGRPDGSTFSYDAGTNLFTAIPSSFSGGRPSVDVSDDGRTMFGALDFTRFQIKTAMATGFAVVSRDVISSSGNNQIGAAMVEVLDNGVSTVYSADADGNNWGGYGSLSITRGLGSLGEEPSGYTVAPTCASPQLRRDLFSSLSCPSYWSRGDLRPARYQANALSTWARFSAVAAFGAFGNERLYYGHGLGVMRIERTQGEPSYSDLDPAGTVFSVDDGAAYSATNGPINMRNSFAVNSLAVAFGTSAAEDVVVAGLATWNYDHWSDNGLSLPDGKRLAVSTNGGTSWAIVRESAMPGVGRVAALALDPPQDASYRTLWIAGQGDDAAAAAGSHPGLYRYHGALSSLAAAGVCAGVAVDNCFKKMLTVPRTAGYGASSVERRRVGGSMLTIVGARSRLFISGDEGATWTSYPVTKVTVAGSTNDAGDIRKITGYGTRIFMAGGDGPIEAILPLSALGDFDKFGKITLTSILNSEKIEFDPSRAGLLLMADGRLAMGSGQGLIVSQRPLSEQAAPTVVVAMPDDVTGRVTAEASVSTQAAESFAIKVVEGSSCGSLDGYSTRKPVSQPEFAVKIEFYKYAAGEVTVCVLAFGNYGLQQAAASTTFINSPNTFAGDTKLLSAVEAPGREDDFNNWSRRGWGKLGYYIATYSAADGFISSGLIDGVSPVAAGVSVSVQRSSIDGDWGFRVLGNMENWNVGASDYRSWLPPIWWPARDLDFNGSVLSSKGGVTTNMLYQFGGDTDVRLAGGIGKIARLFFNGGGWEPNVARDVQLIKIDSNDNEVIISGFASQASDPVMQAAGNGYWLTYVIADDDVIFRIKGQPGQLSMFRALLLDSVSELSAPTAAFAAGGSTPMTGTMPHLTLNLSHAAEVAYKFVQGGDPSLCAGLDSGYSPKRAVGEAHPSIQIPLYRFQPGEVTACLRAYGEFSTAVAETRLVVENANEFTSPPASSLVSAETFGSIETLASNWSTRGWGLDGYLFFTHRNDQHRDVRDGRLPDGVTVVPTQSTGTDGSLSERTQVALTDWGSTYFSSELQPLWNPRHQIGDVRQGALSYMMQFAWGADTDIRIRGGQGRLVRIFLASGNWGGSKVAKIFDVSAGEESEVGPCSYAQPEPGCNQFTTSADDPVMPYTGAGYWLTYYIGSDDVIIRQKTAGGLTWFRAVLFD